MAQSTTAVNDCDVVVSLDNDSGVLTDISGSTNAVQIRLTNEIGTYRRVDNDYPVRRLLSKDATLSLAVLYSTTADEALDILRDWVSEAVAYNNARTVRVDVPDSSVGSDRYQMEVLPDGLDLALAADNAGPVMVSATLQSTGGLTVSTIT